MISKSKRVSSGSKFKIGEKFPTTIDWCEKNVFRAKIKTNYLNICRQPTCVSLIESHWNHICNANAILKQELCLLHGVTYPNWEGWCMGGLWDSDGICCSGGLAGCMPLWPGGGAPAIIRGTCWAGIWGLMGGLCCMGGLFWGILGGVSCVGDRSLGEGAVSTVYKRHCFDSKPWISNMKRKKWFCTAITMERNKENHIKAWNLQRFSSFQQQASMENAVKNKNLEYIHRKQLCLLSFVQKQCITLTYYQTEI